MYLGDTKIAKAYLGDDLVYQSIPPDIGEEAEYIETSGDAWLNTGIKQTTGNYELTIVMQWTGSTLSDFETFVGYIKDGGTTPRSGLHKYNSKWMFGTNKTNIYNGTAPNNNKHTLLIKGDNSNPFEELFIDGVSRYLAVQDLTGIGSSNAITYFLGCRNKNGTVDNPCYARFYGLNYKKFGNSSHTKLTAEYNFTPWYKGGVFGMYDTIAGTFFSSISGTEFTGQLLTT